MQNLLEKVATNPQSNRATNSKQRRFYGIKEKPI